MQNKSVKKIIKYRFIRLLIIVLVSTFLIEAVLIYGLTFLNFIPSDKELLIDLIILILMITPLFYTLLYVPIIKSIQKLHDKELKIKTKAHETQSLLNDVLMLTLQEQTLEEILSPILEKLIKFEWLQLEQKGAIFLVEENAEKLILKVEKNFNEFSFKPCSYELTKTCSCENAFENNDLILNFKTNEHATVNSLQQGHICIPILNDNKLLGAIIIYSKNKIVRDSDERKLLSSYAAIVSKIIIHYKHEEEINNLNKNLVEKNKNLEQFAYITSHDLQEPLRTINSFVEMIEKKHSLNFDNTVNDYFKFITEATNRMRKLINSLLEYSRLGKNKQYINTNLNTLLKEVLDDIRANISENNAKIEIETLPTIYVDVVEIRQLFQNLILNAIKFRQKDVIPEIRISAKKEKEYWLFAVHDNGIGIDEKHNKKIFQIFQRLHNRKDYEGLGIGLAFCEKIVEMHDGSIWVESEKGKSSTFYFTISDNLKNKKFNITNS